ncbi:MAG: hypothetical protein ACTSVW_05340 [Candidatus Njordarchaeales archaeon]
MPRKPREKRIREILMCMYLQGSITRKKLQNYLKISKSWLSELVKELRNRRLISVEKRNRHETLYITEEGQELLFRQKGSSQTTIIKIIEHELRKAGIDFEKANLNGIDFNFKIALERRTILIKIIEGFMIPNAPEDLEELRSVLNLILSSKKRTQEIETSKIEIILSRLVDQKGLLSRIINFVAHTDDTVILIICGTHPKNWPEDISQKINELGRICRRSMLVHAKESLISLLNRIPRNLTIVHSGDVSIREIIDKIFKTIEVK